MKKVLLGFLLVIGVSNADMCNYHMQAAGKQVKKVGMYLRAKRVNMAKIAASSMQRHHAEIEVECSPEILDQIRDRQREFEYKLVDAGILDSSIY